MASWQAHLTVWLLKWRFKKRIRGTPDITTARAVMNGVRHKLPRGVNAIEDPVARVPGEWLEPELGHTAGTLLYLHGGGYIACSPQTHRPITAGFVRRGFEVFAPDYRLAPEHPFPAAVEDAVRAYRGLLEKDIPPERIAIGGDSAGGGLALATMLSLRDAGDPLPAAAILFSPWTDLAGTGETLKSNTDRDAMFHGDNIIAATAPYLNGGDARNPLASPLYADLRGLPPMMIHAGTYEVLLDDSRRLADRARAAGVDAVLQTWPVVPHVWQLFRMPEAAQSLDSAATFLKARLQGAAAKLAA